MRITPLPEALETVREITDRAKAMGIGLVAYPLEDIEALLLALEPKRTDTRLK